MNKEKCSLKLYSDFLIGTQSRYSGAELSRVSNDISHDAISRWLRQTESKPQDLWGYVKASVNKDSGYLIGDDTLLDKRYSRENELAKVQYSGNEHRLMNGISVVNLLWTESRECIPVDYRIYNKEQDGKTKNDLFQEMLKYAHRRRFTPLYVLMDAWYASVENLKVICRFSWKFICSIKDNRIVSHNRVSMAISDLDFTKKQVIKIWLKAFGEVLICKVVAKNGDITYLVTNDLNLTNYVEFTEHFQHRWIIEEFHRGIKQTTGIEKCYSIKATSQKNHIFASMVAFVKLELRRIKEQLSWYEQKLLIVRSAVFNYLNYSTA